MSVQDLERLMGEMHDLVEDAEAEIAAIKQGLELSREQADRPRLAAAPGKAIAPALVISAQVQRNPGLSPKPERPGRLRQRLGEAAAEPESP